MQVFEGVIVPSKMIKTAVVEIVRKTAHPMYKKLLKRSKKHKVNTAGFEVAVGDKVNIVQERPLSKGKHFKIVKVMKKLA